MQFIDLAAQQKHIRQIIEANISSVLDHGKYIMGPEVERLEARLADFVGTKYCISCSSGTDALLMALMAHGVGPGDAVFSSPFTFIATAEVVALLGATPVFVDIDPATFNISPDQLKKAIQAVQDQNPELYPLPGQARSQRLTPKAVIPVDLFGLPAEYDPINRMAGEHGLMVIEDAAQSLGGSYQSRMAGSLADMGCTSFFPAKPLGCYGDGGAVFTDDQDLARELSSVRVHGKGSHKYDNARIGINGRLDTLQAAILLAKLDIFPAEIEQRQLVAKYYSDHLASCSTFSVPWVPEGSTSAWAQYSLLAADSEHRQRVQDRLQEQEIPSVIYYPKPLHEQTAFAHLGYAPEDMPVSHDCASRIFSLPMHPYLRAEEQESIVQVLKREGSSER